MSEDSFEWVCRTEGQVSDAGRGGLTFGRFDESDSEVPGPISERRDVIWSPVGWHPFQRYDRSLLTVPPARQTGTPPG
jgi:hypothetical protein